MVDSISDPMNTNRFRLVDAITDVAILAILFLPASIYTLPEQLLRGDSFISQLLHLAIVFACYFGVAYSYADVYYTVAKKRHRLEVMEFKNEKPFFFLSCFMFFSLLLSAIAIWTQMKMPVFTSILVAVLSGIFGLSFGMEVNLEADTNPNKNISSSIKRRYGHSITDWMPYLLLTFLIIYPLEYLLQLSRMEEKLLLYILPIFGGSFATYYFGRRIDKWLGPRIEIDKKMNTLTTVITLALTIVSILSLGFMQLVATSNDLARSEGLFGTIVVILMFGIIPLRICRLFLMRHFWAGRLIGAATLGLYVLRQLKII